MNGNPITRRRLLQTTASAIGAARLGFAAGGKFSHALGVQLYTVRSVINGHEDETLKRLAEVGYTEVELAGSAGSIETLAPILKRYKIKPVSIHMDAFTVLGNAPQGAKPPTIEETIASAKKYGIEYIVFPFLRPELRGTADDFKKLAEKLNRAAEPVHAAGLTFCYHNHAFEFGGPKGQRPIDIYDANLDKKLVNFEFDVFWLSVSGNDPVAILKQFAGRVPLIHLKDKPAGFPVQYNETVPKETFKEVGSGSLDFGAILRTAESIGVKHYFVEQDQTPGDPLESLKKSYTFLRDVKA